MSADIDWAWVLINMSIIRYLNKHETLGISLSNKRIRSKLYPTIFNNLIINNNVLSHQSNYFQNEIYYQFGNLSYIEKIKKFKKYGYNNNLAFKEIQIDPFIESAKEVLKSASTHCKSLSLKFFLGSESGRGSYFIFQLYENFYNLNKLTLYGCYMPFIRFSNLLAKLENLYILNMNQVRMVLNPSEDPNLAMLLQYPKSLKELGYIYVRLGTTDWYLLKPRDFIQNSKLGYREEDLEILPQSLPNLKLLRFYDPNPDTERMRKFIALNPDVEYINEYTPFVY